MEAGVQALRLNPGNIRKPEHIKARRERGARTADVPIRIGVNAGSLDPAMAEQHGGITPEALVASAMHELDLFREVDFDDVKISVKASNVPLMIDAYRLLVRDDRSPVAPRRHRSRSAAAGLDQGGRRHRHAARRGHRRHDPLLAHRRSGRGGQGRAHAARGARPARAQGPRPHRVPVVRPGRGRRDRRRLRRAGRARGAQHPAAGRGDGVRRERSRRSARGRPRHRRRVGARATCS